ncbi:type I restriction endonuclease [Faunimonas sp. B44]|uniref:type I restriction endonuclease n=1 Tax=Faunimonas sp. B44 TaxID=3461493 RepID=UPI004044AFB5
MMDEFRDKLTAFAQRAVALAPSCRNEEGTKQFLILPFLAVLGYDDRNPHEVCPEHGADFSEKYKNRVDYAILKDGTPIIAVECKCCGATLKDERGQLRAYFNAAPTVKMGALTDGIIWEFYADSDEPNMMDATAFLTVDLREIAKGKIENSMLDGIRSLQKAAFDPDNIGAEAKRKLLFHNILQQLSDLSDHPSEQFTRMLLQNAGLSHVRAKSLPEYQAMVKNAFSEFTNLRILRRLDLPTKEVEKPQIVTPQGESEQPLKLDDKINTTQTELSVFDYTKRRLSFLVKDEDLFLHIDQIAYRDYQGKFVVYYKRERKGRLFDFVEGDSPKYRFRFGDDIEINSDRLSDIDQPLLAVFRKRVQEDGGKAASAQ